MIDCDAQVTGASVCEFQVTGSPRATKHPLFFPGPGIKTATDLCGRNDAGRLTHDYFP